MYRLSLRAEKSSDFCAKAVGRWKGLPSRRAIGRGEFSSRGVLEGLDGVMRASIHFIVCIPAWGRLHNDGEEGED
ncbi:hypothetical protein TNCT_19831 [Trichonephila clavata]|uniref:Uncharacterized protein n=2 Tax=Trichonephila TaxID=2585208 RepID=A0A8X6HVR5_TRICU|nr:hypothetical protein TNCT_19831 [Trichonephila clavata]GFY40776.1 hypothetical protein TNIN_129501 [Trichonephila inaurata madagascariensis]